MASLFSRSLEGVLQGELHGPNVVDRAGDRAEVRVGRTTVRLSIVGDVERIKEARRKFSDCSCQRGKVFATDISRFWKLGPVGHRVTIS